jgi:hypothetical protein
MTDDEVKVAVPPAAGRGRGARQRASRRRWLVHLALLGSFVASLVLEPLLTLHIAIGLVFVFFVIAHLWQRKRTSVSLARKLYRPPGWLHPTGRLALADAVLAALTAVMLASGFWDWLAFRTTIRWHALSGVALAGVTLAHTIRRRRRLRRSTVD